MVYSLAENDEYFNISCALLQTYHQRVVRQKKHCWNFTVMAVMLISNSQFEHINDEAYAKDSQHDITGLTDEDLNLFSKF